MRSNNTNNAHHKISDRHLARKAIVYLRQSSDKQVRDNPESQRLQYAMVNRAHELGWVQLEVIDVDLGRSASVGAPRRHGFERMVAQVGFGEVGIIFSYEISRLSRTDKDWCQLFEICPLFDTLVADDQHVYDLNIPDDQLVLGIKGSISVMELRTLKARLLAGIEEKAKRGELIRILAPGYVKGSMDQIVKDPNQRVQQAMQLVFDRFRATGTMRQTFKWFHVEKIALPVNRCQDGKRELAWQLPTHAFIVGVLKNPIYAGAFTYGQRPCETVVVDGRPVKRPGTPRPPEACRVFIRDHHEGYIDWATFEENQRMIRANNLQGDQNEAAGPARAGHGLLVGLLRCGRCGRKVSVCYSGKNGTRGRYMCRGDYATGGNYCLGFGAGVVDRRVAKEVLELISPLGVAASLEAARQLASKGEERRSAVAKQLEQVAYEERRAYEQFDQVDPRNRLVASNLERRWNAKLEELDALNQRLAQMDAECQPPSAAEQARVRELGDRFSEVWESAHCPRELKKRIVRTVIEEIVVNLDELTQRLIFIIHWKGGVHTTLEMSKSPPSRGHQTSQEDLEIIRAMALRYGDDEIARVLVKLGRRTAKGRRWSERAVYTARRNHGIAGQKRSKEDPEILSLARASRYSAVSQGAIRRVVTAGILKVEQVVAWAPWEIRKSDLDASPVREILEVLRKTGKLVLPAAGGDKSDRQLPLIT
jgi:DNA invertase Pin-like site-specific DNA recombinase